MSQHPNSSPTQPPVKSFTNEAIPHSQLLPSNIYNLWPEIVEEEKVSHVYDSHHPSSQRRVNWPVRVTTEDPNVGNEGQDAVARIFRRAYGNIRDLIIYAEDRFIPGTASEDMASKFVWYEDKLMTDFQKIFD
ncbi:hypothetical protein O181_057329 [Austropuccinia psidii MF-1]|uniref:Uncharacterized protein n=1 Tax=Austropuccinia psidii MF-1 TaxID=1389203 RepID=A0A9Q3HWK6_9BASI|nr:hypothetical protein [Austropuccinia psidii MF-1]